MDNYRCVLFTATAGAGKSMLMRYLYLKFLEEQSDRLPIFIELRDLNQNVSTLQEFLRSKIADYIEGFSEQQLRYALDTGRIVLFLDGFDEIDYDKRKERERQINDMAARYQKLWTFVSSRPAEGFTSWEAFHVFRVQPFSKQQVELLISKINYDEEIKGIFRKKLEAGLYETHKEFLTNPLLTIMMLITLAQFAEVPAKIHLFYEYAFEALFGRHDVTKGGFQRKRHTSLPLDDFKRLFSYFCMVTYLREKYSFSEDDVLATIEQCIKSSQISVDKLEFRKDLTESTCMLMLDGLDYTFSHRSFQEYFAAYFIARVKVDEFEKGLPKLVARGSFDNVIKMISEMNKEKFEEAWALPALEMLCDAAEGVDAKSNFIGFGRAVLGGEAYFFADEDLGKPNYLTLHFLTDEDAESLKFGKGFTIKKGIITKPQLRMALYRVYNLFDTIHSKLRYAKTSDKLIKEKLATGELLGSDPRFKMLREGHKRKRGEDPKPIRIEDKDSSWLRECEIGQFFIIESELLPKLRDEVKHRVKERKKGSTEIFGN